MTMNQPQSQLMMLPRELRDYIYEAVFTNHQADVAYTSHEVRNDGIRLACKQTRAETPELYFRYTTFYCATCTEFKRFLCRGPKRHYGRQLTKIKLGWATARVDNYPNISDRVIIALHHIQSIFQDLRNKRWWPRDVPAKVLRGCIFTHKDNTYATPCEPYRLWVREAYWSDQEPHFSFYRSVQLLLELYMD
ncbi:hypothetical protein Slin15195_G102210 [Septoria linicola]|uniref:Uncharacterized protein n=1 Tax=Septoria linicola TaxID=215465 RepID=A0A9Q9AVY3_9PEZI|nr:hypothetical protein Slin14017_G065210 [Septoria linicola]USW56902.1 hypothetical protein Slin15195_G102210 [Septoria linicola]